MYAFNQQIGTHNVYQTVIKPHRMNRLFGIMNIFALISQTLLGGDVKASSSYIFIPLGM